MTTKFCIIAAASALLTFTAPVHADEPWQRPWPSVKAASAKQCAQIFDTYQMQAVCMDNERNGYEKMQSDFGMPADVATKAKAKCGEIFDTFQMQAVCMQNEKKGYDKMNKY